MSLKEFRTELLDQLIDFLWRQWSVLGVSGEAGAQDDWVIDPEALLIFSVGIARYDARLFDAIMDWLTLNNEMLDTVRLRKYISELEKNCNKWSTESIDTCINLRIVGSITQYLNVHVNKAKWENLAEKCREMTEKLVNKENKDTLFIDKTEQGQPVDESNLDTIFDSFSLLRPKRIFQNKSKEVPVTAGTNLRFLLRAFFGVGAKAECVLYLLTHEYGRPREIAASTGFYWLSVQDVLSDMAKSRLIQTRVNSKWIEYWLSRNRWWQFISFSEADENKIPKWLNWWSIFSALSHLWYTLDVVTNENISQYMTSSKMQDSIEILHQEFSRAGFDIPPPPASGLPSDMYEKAALQFLRSIFRNKETVR